MHKLRKILVISPLAVALAGYGITSWSYVTAEDQKLIEAADCDEITKEPPQIFCGRKKVG